VLPFRRGADDVQLDQNAGSKKNPATLIAVGRIEIRRLAGGLGAFDGCASVQLGSERDDRFDQRSDLAIETVEALHPWLDLP
jgi:hypothetical protein